MDPYCRSGSSPTDTGRGGTMARDDERTDESSKQDAEPREQSDETTATIDTGGGEQRIDVDLGADVPHQIPDAATRLDVFRDSTLKNLEDTAKHTTGEVPGGTALTDPLGKSVARHDGPGIADMKKDAHKHGVDAGGTNPLDGELSARPAATGPEMPPTEDPQRDPSLVSDDNLKGLMPNQFGDDKKKFVPMDGSQHKAAQDPGVKDSKGQTLDDWKKKTSPDGGTKYSDPDQAGTTATGPASPIDEAPAGAHDVLGHRVNPLDGPDDSQQPDLDDKTIAGLVKSHKGLDPTQTLTDP